MRNCTQKLGQNFSWPLNARGVQHRHSAVTGDCQFGRAADDGVYRLLKPSKRENYEFFTVPTA
eukprot:5567773-Pleurochrysis_carterae.AAC.2